MPVPTLPVQAVPEKRLISPRVGLHVMPASQRCTAVATHVLEIGGYGCTGEQSRYGDSRESDAQRRT
eukprot:1567728-Rhodomonas_salina.1